jgi:DNA-binding SARP family transcriptional activator
MPSPSGSDRPLWFAVLGPLQARRGDVPLELGPFKQRVLLAALLCQPNRVMPVEQLLDVIWDNDQPRTARKNLQVYLWKLRKIVGERIQHLAYGYQFQVSADELDLLRFGSVVTAGRKAVQGGDLERARTLLREALQVWRDRPLVDLLSNPFISAESATLMERYLEAYEDWADLEIGAGRHLGIVGQLGQLARLHPFRERLSVAFMTAVSQGGNRREALAHYETHRQYMARELGLEPSPVLRRLYQSILVGEPAPDVPSTAAAHLRGYLKPAQLPRDLSDFVGRETEVTRLTGAFADRSRGVDTAVITGPPGVGKTALAVHAGHLLAPRFTDGQVFVMLRDQAGAPRLWRDVLGELMRSTGFEAPPPAEQDAALGLWRSWVADRRFLFVLDDAPDEISARRLLPGLGSNGTIVTSGRKLGGLDAGCRVELGEFSPAEATELLKHSLGQPRMLQAGDAVRRIVACCGGQPLAIRVIAAKLTVLHHLSVAAYAEHLDQLTDILDELAIGDMSLRGRLERSYIGLPPHQQDAFRALGSLSAPLFSYEEARAALSGLSEPVERALEELMDANLLAPAAEGDVVAHSVRYVMPASAYHYSASLSRDPADDA